jgi:hypothetical protein
VADVLPPFWMALHPQPVRFAVVSGAIETPPARGDGTLPAVQDCDGPAFHQAADLLDRMRDDDRRFAYESADGPSAASALVGPLGDLLYAALLDWTPRQLDIFRAYAAGHSQVHTAQALGVAQSSVSRTLAAIDHTRFGRALDAWRGFFAPPGAADR